jgi:steroid delta-isomerase-like uncharacterized protein
MTLEANKAIIRKWMDAWKDKDLDAIEELFAPDYTVNETLIGIEGVNGGVEFLHSVLADISADMDDLVAEGEKVVLRWTVRGKHVGELMGIPPTGKILELKGTNIYLIRNGKIAANHEQTNMLEVVQSLKDG